MISNELTIGTIKDSVEKKIFNIENPSEIEKQYIKREEAIKSTINKCMEQIIELGEAPGLEKLTKRQKIKSEQCVENLSKYIQELINELDRENIQNYCQELQDPKYKFPFGLTGVFMPDINILMSNSFHIAVTTNILWSPRVTVREALCLSKGQLDLNELGKHLPEIIKDIKKVVLPYLKMSEIYSDFYYSVQEALKCYSKKCNKGCNLIIMTTIEGIVRKLTTFLTIPHELGSDFSEEKYSSLNTLLRDVNWKKDFEINSTRLSLIIGENKTLKERKEDIMTEVNGTVMVDINTRLDFLKGRFKDDRDLIMHGSYLNYSNKWNLFLNFSALVETQKVCLYYDKLYGN